MNIYLISTAGYPNYGDELLLQGWLDAINNQHPTAKIWVDCHSPGNAQALLNHSYSNVRFVDFVWRLAWSCQTDSQHEAVAYGLAAWSVHQDNWRRFEAAASILLDSDIVHIIGAGFINSIWPKHLSIPGIVRAAPYHKKDRKLFITGAGLLPLDQSVSPSLGLVFHGFNFVDLRDHESFNFLKYSGLIDPDVLSMTGDDTFLMDRQVDLSEYQVPACIKRVAVCLQSDFNKSIDAIKVIPQLVDEVKRVFSKDVEIIYYEFLPGVDNKFFTEFAEHFDSVRHITFLELMEHGLNLNAQDFVISSRFHMHLLAARSGARGVWLDFHSGYYDIKHRSVVASGSSWPQYLIGAALEPDHIMVQDSTRMDEVRRKKLQLFEKLYGA